MLKPGLRDALALVAGLVIGVCAAVPSLATPPGVLAVVGGHEITLADFEAEMERRGGANVFHDLVRRRALLDEMVQFRALVLKARAVGLDRAPEFVHTVERLLANRYRRDHFEAPVTEGPAVTDEEVQRYYEDHLETFLTPERCRLALIWIEVPKRADAQRRGLARQRAEQARTAALELDGSVKGFGQLAREYSDDGATRYVGGMVGWLYRARAGAYKWPETVVRPAFDLSQAGAVSPVLEAEDGFYIWRLFEREERQPVPLQRLADGIRARMLRDRQGESREAAYRELLEELGARVDYERLEALPLPEPKPPEEKTPPPLPGG